MCNLDGFVVALGKSIYQMHDVNSQFVGIFVPLPDLNDFTCKLGTKMLQFILSEFPLQSFELLM